MCLGCVSRRLHEVMQLFEKLTARCLQTEAGCTFESTKHHAILHQVLLLSRTAQEKNAPELALAGQQHAYNAIALLYLHESNESLVLSVLPLIILILRV